MDKATKYVMFNVSISNLRRNRNALGPKQIIKRLRDFWLCGETVEKSEIKLAVNSSGEYTT